MKDFTLDQYQELLKGLRESGYEFITYEQYCSGVSVQQQPFVILRHDVDRRPVNSLHTARMEASMGIKASYYFRSLPVSNKPNVIQSIARLGHEIGYHYEDMALAKGDVEKAMEHFRRKLMYFRQFYPVKTICMHGAPTSRYDGRDLWKSYDYHDEGLIGEPYFDTDFSQLLYLTDTGRCWNGYKVSVRDKIPVHQERWERDGLTFHSTKDILLALRDKESALSKQKPSIMITTHPQRWTNDGMLWTNELVQQTMKNTIKRVLIRFRK